MINRNTRQNKQELKYTKNKHKICSQRKGVLFKSKLEQMEMAYNNHEQRNFI